MSTSCPVVFIFDSELGETEQRRIWNIQGVNSVHVDRIVGGGESYSGDPKEYKFLRRNPINYAKRFVASSQAGYVLPSTCTFSDFGLGVLLEGWELRVMRKTGSSSFVAIDTDVWTLLLKL